MRLGYKIIIRDPHFGTAYFLLSLILEAATEKVSQFLMTMNYEVN
jgi:hypothetical protein